MVQTFPMALADFFEGLPIQSFASDLGEAMEFNQSGAGEVLSADLGPRLWRNQIVIRTGDYATIEQIKARLNLLRYPNRSLFVHAMPFMAPQSDPDGSILGSRVIRLADVDTANNRVVTLSGFAPGLILRPATSCRLATAVTRFDMLCINSLVMVSLTVVVKLKLKRIHSFAPALHSIRSSD